MTVKDLADLLEKEASVYRAMNIAVIRQNRHMNDLTDSDIAEMEKLEPRLRQKIIDALLVDFINFIATRQGLDLGLYTKHLTGDKKPTEEQKSCGCKKCDENTDKGKPPVQFKKKKTTCFICKKEVSQVLDLHHTNADLCSLECEKKYWLDILY